MLQSYEGAQLDGISQLGAAACDPTQEAADQIEAPPSAVASEPVFDETHCVTLDKLFVGTVLKAPEQPAPAQVKSSLASRARNRMSLHIAVLSKCSTRNNSIGIIRNSA